MGYHSLWKYCTGQQCADYLLSLALVDREEWSREKKLSCVYALSRHAHRHYHPVEISRKTGSTRLLLQPDALLKSVQRNLLHHVLEERILSPYATAYHPGASILGNALPHVGKSQILKLDIADFFPSITYAMVLDRAFPACYFPPQVAAVLAGLCCCGDTLPQGAPTSPAVANLVMQPFDRYMGAWCSKRGIAYTRYCDDMTFSGRFHAKMVENKVCAFLQTMGFALNHGKTKHIRSHARQQVTGVVVNQKPQAPRAYRRSLRQELYYCGRFGPAGHLARMDDKDDLPKGKEGVLQYLKSLLGKVGYVLSINPEDQGFRQAKQSVLQWIRIQENEKERG